MLRVSGGGGGKKYVSLIPELRRQMQANLWIWEQSGLQSEFYDRPESDPEHLEGCFL